MTAEPTVSDLQRLGLSKGNAWLLHAYIIGTKDPENDPANQKWKRQCYHWPPSRSELVLKAANRLMGGYGDEPIQDPNYWDGYHCDVRAAYVNMGDTYAETLLIDHESGEYQVCCWGDYVEELGL